MIGRTIYGLALLIGCLSGASPADAKECGPLKRLASADLVAQSENRLVIPVTVNGSPRQFLLDTGGIFTQIAPSAVTNLQLPIQTGAEPVYDVSGRMSSAYVKVASFSLGGMTGNDVFLRVSPSNIGADGLIAPDILTRYDVEMDFAGKKLNYFLPDHCYGKVIYWPHGDVARVPIVLADKRWIKVPVKLDGKSFMAIIDTGATRTTISTDTASDSFGLTASSPGMDPAGNVNGDPNLASHYHTFSTLTFEGVTITKPRLVIMPDRMADIPQTQMLTNLFIRPMKREGLPELILGMDVLKHLHLYFAFEEHNLYVTAAQPPSPDAANTSP